MKQLRFEDVPKQPCSAGIIETVLDNDKKTQLHTHDFFELFIVKQGCVLHINNEDETCMQRGDFSVVKDTDSHCFQKMSAERAAFVNISFSAAFFQELLKEKGIDEAKMFPYFTGKLSPSQLAATEEYLNLLTGSAERSEQHKLRQKELLKSLLQLILLDNMLTEGRLSKDAPLWLQQAIGALRRPDILQGGLKSFIYLCGHSQEHVTRQTRRYYHQTPSELINYYRIQYSQELLLNTDLSILEVSMCSGYESVSYFNRIFLQYTGVSPRTYRNSMKLIYQ